MKTKKSIYICGPMSSHPDDFNFPAFFKASKELEEQGYEAINPASLDEAAGFPLERLKQLSPAEFQEFLKGAVKRDLDAIQTCQAIAMLPGWESSKGAKAELALAQWLGLDEVYLDESKLPYNSDERAEWNSDSYKIDMGDYSSTATAQYAPGNSSYVDRDGRGCVTDSGYAPDDPKGAAGVLKAPMWLLPSSATRQTAWVHKLGAEKYGIFNWRQTGVCASTYISAIMRHLDQWRDGEDMDAESGYSHIAHIAASCNILLDAQHCGKLRDDRNKV